MTHDTTRQQMIPGYTRLPRFSLKHPHVQESYGGSSRILTTDDHRSWTALSALVFRPAALPWVLGSREPFPSAPQQLAKLQWHLTGRAKAIGRPSVQKIPDEGKEAYLWKGEGTWHDISYTVLWCIMLYLKFILLYVLSFNTFKHI